MGRCKRCQMERTFPAQLNDTDRGNDYEDLRDSGSSVRGALFERVTS